MAKELNVTLKGATKGVRLRCTLLTYTLTRDAKVHNPIGFKNTGAGMTAGVDQKGTDFGKSIETVVLRGILRSDAEMYRQRKFVRDDLPADGTNTVQFGLDADTTKLSWDGRVQRHALSSGGTATTDPNTPVEWSWTLTFNVGSAFSPFGG